MLLPSSISVAQSRSVDASCELAIGNSRGRVGAGDLEAFFFFSKKGLHANVSINIAVDCNLLMFVET